MFEVRIVIPGLELLAEAASCYVKHITKRPAEEGAKLVFKVTDDQKPEKFELDITGVKDAHGHDADSSKLVYKFESTDEGIATVGPDPDAPTDQTKGVLTFVGDEGTVTLTGTVSDTHGNVLFSAAANFTVTAGDPASIATGSFKFADLTEDPDSTPAPPDTSGTGTGTPEESPVIQP